MKRDDARRPEPIGFVDVMVGPVEALLSPEEHSHTSSMLVVGAQQASIFLTFPLDDELVTLALSTKQAYHLGAALMRARARALRWDPPPPANRSEGTPA